MASFEPPRPPDPYQYRAEPIERENHEKESRTNRPSPGFRRSTLLLRLLRKIHKVFSLFETTSKEGLTPSEERALRKNLAHLLESLQILTHEDHSQDAIFLSHLSLLWRHALEDTARLRKDAPAALLFQKLIEEVQDYPPTQEHTLGYYLKESAGLKWLPFPYMELIFQIYSIHQTEGEKSTLSHWIAQIKSIKTALQPLK
jgi:hypothetical protein